ncbi:MAG: hypothetical protein ACOCXP_02580 [Candidatus Dojkabacteria bacterium]
MKGILRKIYRKLVLSLSNWSIRKYGSRIIVVYGWDFSEPVRETLYSLLETQENIRRNTKRIDWDMGLSLFILGVDYEKKTWRAKVITNLLKSIALLIKPTDYQGNVLLVNLHAKNYDTLRFWLDSEGIEQVILLPTRENITDYKIDLVKEHVNEDLILDLHKFSNSSDISSDLKSILTEVNDRYLNEVGYNFGEDDIENALLKSEFNEHFLTRISEKIQENET